MNQQNQPNKVSFNENSFIGEVIESSLSAAIGQCWRWNNLPTFASLIELENNNQRIFGCVTDIRTESTDPSRKPFAYQKTEEELLSQQPQIFELLKSTFTIQILGYQEATSKSMFFQVPPQPCKIHSFIRPVNEKTFAEIVSHPESFSLLFSFCDNPTRLEELLLALLCTIHRKNLLTKDFFRSFYENFAILNNNNYKRVKIFFERLEYIHKKLEKGS